MDKTANYNLPQWVGTDPIRMKPFNDAFDGIDKALKANADAAQALQSGKADAQTVSALAKNLGAAGHNCRVAFGSYVGDGNVGQAAPTTLASPFYPVLVLVQRVISGNNSIANPSVFVRPNDKGTNAADKSTMDSLLYLTWADRFRLVVFLQHRRRIRPAEHLRHDVSVYHPRLRQGDGGRGVRE